MLGSSTYEDTYRPKLLFYCGFLHTHCRIELPTLEHCLKPNLVAAYFGFLRARSAPT